MNEKEKVIALARSEVGYLEKKSNSQLDSKTANAGSGNYTKYARDLDAIGNFYNGKKNGYFWCDIFYDWLMVTCFGVTRALELLCQPLKSCGAGVGYSCDYYKKKGQFYTKPEVGDQIFFKDSKGVRTHTGLVVGVDSKYVYTIEGNAGDGVREKKYAINSSSIYGYGRPKYKVEEKPKEYYSGTYPTLPNIPYKTITGKIKYRTWIKKGDRGNNVRQLQSFLNWSINAKLEVDGIFGKLTKAAVKKFQEKAKIAVDGEYGKESLEASKKFYK